ncbi:conserved hypothetical protein [Gloeothece citriformis PCC 7424]|uniref:Transposase n=1 Tax=Gloeothece citriformis (strain PCC 7424) TaxID=65393 RepID=B7K7R6_GLOC7|nr:conserved hypothetical protein [Gloeothece citriformis PCC 7424]
MKVVLTQNEDLTLFELQKASNAPLRTKTRAYILRLSSQGWKIEKIADFLFCSNITVRRTIHRWNKKGLLGLWDKPRAGRTPTWKPEDFSEIEDLLIQEQCTYSSAKIQQKLLIDKQVSLSQRQIRRILKKNNIAGKEQNNQIKINKIKN